MIYHDIELNFLARNKAEKVPNGYRDLKTYADRNLACGTHYRVVEALTSVDAFGYIQNEYDITLVAIPGSLLFFHKNLEQTREFLKEWEPKLKKKVPANVLVKMICGRFESLDKIINENNGTVRRYKGSQNNWYEKYQEVQYPEWRSVSEIREWTKAILDDRTVLTFMYHDINSWWKKFQREILSKPELTDHDISSATDLMISSRVMSV